LNLRRFILQATSIPPEEVLDGKLSMRTHILHKYRPPLECDLTVEFAGGHAAATTSLA
jgi:hypothetical protein